MFLTNNIKVLGCILFFFNVHPLLAYAVVGFGAASYAPAKYGILTELLPPDKLVFANGWLESTTVVSILLGTLLGGFLISDFFINLINDSGLTATLQINSKSEAGLMVIVLIYALAAFFNLLIPKTGAVYSIYSKNPITLTKRFYESNKILWNDKVGQISLAVTTLFWGAGATLQFIVLQWAQEQLNMTLDKAAMLQGIVALGIIAGSILAGRLVNLRSSIKVLPVGVFMGLVVPLMTLASNIGTASILLIIIGTLAGFFVVPMNALLQHRGYVTLSAGQSIAVQNFNENSNVLVMLSVYAFLLFIDMSANTVVILFGIFVAVTMALVIAKCRRNKSTVEFDSLIGDKRSSVYQK